MKNISSMTLVAAMIVLVIIGYSLAAWFTVGVWSVVVVGIFGAAREITFWEALVIYLAISIVASMFKSKG